MAKTREQLEKECQSTIKLILMEMEALAALPPEVAGDPYEFEARRHRVMRKVWSLFKEAVSYDPRQVQ